MGGEYINRRGERYYLLQGKTKTGKPKYYASRKPDGVAVDAVPDGYELHENPERGIVSVRKVRPSRIRPEEREQLELWTRELAGIDHFIIDRDGDSLIVYTPSTDPGDTVRALERVFGGLPLEKVEWIVTQAYYTAMMRFTLTDADKRRFTLERWCFHGAIDDWFPLACDKPLEELAQQYLPHLNRESFFGLM